ncbi:unnamed protein product [Lampetra planeri]
MNAHGRSSGGDFTSPSSGNGTLQSRHHLHGEDLQQQPREYQLFPQEQFTWSPIAAPRRQPSPPRFPSPEPLTLDTIFNESRSAIRCAFCYSNGASVRTCSSHALKDADGRVQCPVMRAYSCPLCGASGDWAHTISHCPTAREPQRKQILHTHRLSSGKMNSKYRHR